MKTFLMGKMMEAAVAETMQFGAARAEEELYSPYADIAASEFNRQPFAHHEEYVGGLTAETRECDDVMQCLCMGVLICAATICRERLLVSL